MKPRNKNIIRLSIVVVFTFVLASVQAQTVMQKLKSHSQTTEFATALERANLHDKLNTSGPFTIFAPSNEAFVKLSDGQKTNRDLLLNHIFTGMGTERSLRAMSEITCLSGKNITIEVNSTNQMSVNSITVLTPNIRARNGIIHIITGVIR